MKITQEHVEGALLMSDAANDIIVAAEDALSDRGVTDTRDVVGALLAAAWVHHKTLAPEQPELFAQVLRNMADSVEAHGRPH